MNMNGQHKPTLSPVNGVLHKLDDIMTDGSVAHEPLGPRDKLGAVQSTLPRRETECESEPDFFSYEVVVKEEVVKAPSEKVEELLKIFYLLNLQQNYVQTSSGTVCT